MKYLIISSYLYKTAYSNDSSINILKKGIIPAFWLKKLVKDWMSSSLTNYFNYMLKPIIVLKNSSSHFD